jgi:hypothetical protein
MLLYGSTKDGKGPSYTCTYILSGEKGESDECEDEPSDLTVCLSIRPTKDSVTLSVLKDKAEEIAAFAAAMQAKRLNQ